MKELFEQIKELTKTQTRNTNVGDFWEIQIFCTKRQGADHLVMDYSGRYPRKIQYKSFYLDAPQNKELLKEIEKLIKTKYHVRYHARD